MTTFLVSMFDNEKIIYDIWGVDVFGEYFSIIMHNKCRFAW